MALQPKRLIMSVEDYFKLDQTSPEKRYEYIDGEVYLMTGGSPSHALIIANLIGELKAQLRGQACKTFSSDAKVRLSETRYLCPDVTVSCVERDRQVGVDMIENPR